MALTDSDLERIANLFHKLYNERTKPLDQRISNHSIKMGRVREELVESKRDMSELENEQNDARLGMEKFIMSVVGKQIAPVMQKAIDTEAAAVAGANAAIASKKASVGASDAAIDAKTGVAELKGRSKSTQWASIIGALLAALANLLGLINHFYR